MEWKWFAVFSLLIALLSAPGARADETTCMSDYEDGAILHFICFCNSPRLVHPAGSGGGADDFVRDPIQHGKFNLISEFDSEK